jgi:uncharacterized protein (TIGR00251 family)
VVAAGARFADVTELSINERAGAVTFAIRVQPRASRTTLAGVQGGTLKIRLAAPPVDGEANDECVRFLARTLDVARSAVEIASGHASRNKLIRVHGLTAAQALARLGPESG